MQKEDMKTKSHIILLLSDTTVNVLMHLLLIFLHICFLAHICLIFLNTFFFLYSAEYILLDRL